ncbi:MAG: putative toxin-antitoxin system toxin component, PIN family [Rectinemataceae bacterium]
MRVVLDTKVLVSGLLKPSSWSGKILELAFGGVFEICLDARILQEYREVLHRPKFAFDSEQIEVLLNGLEDLGLWLPIEALDLNLADKDDLVFLEVAVGGRAHYIVTGNKRHFPDSPFAGIHILEPRQFVERVAD